MVIASQRSLIARECLQVGAAAGRCMWKFSNMANFAQGARRRAQPSVDKHARREKLPKRNWR